MQPSLFEPPSGFDRANLTTKLRALAARNIFIGTSSWRYEGWLGQIYTPERYYSRGKFSKIKFHKECLQEYAETFPVVGGDFSFYSIPEPKFWAKLFTDAPAALKWTLKVPEDFTARRFPTHPRYGARGGTENPAFLDADLFVESFLEPLSAYAERIAVLIFEFGTFSKATYPDPRVFFDDLDRFFRDLPKTMRYAVEIRNDDFLDARYFEALRANGVAHTFTSWARMPSLRAQLEIGEAFTAPHVAARALLRPGRNYEEAVKLFAPYTEVKEEYPSARQAIRDLVRRATDAKLTAYLHVNNRLEGNAIQTIAGIV